MGNQCLADAPRHAAVRHGCSVDAFQINQQHTLRQPNSGELLGRVDAPLAGLRGAASPIWALPPALAGCARAAAGLPLAATHLQTLTSIFGDAQQEKERARERRRWLKTMGPPLLPLVVLCPVLSHSALRHPKN